MLTGTALLYGFPLLLGTGLSVLLSSQGDLWAAGGFCLGIASGFAILHGAIALFGGAIPGFAEPELAGRATESEVQPDIISLSN